MDEFEPINNHNKINIVSLTFVIAIKAKDYVRYTSYPSGFPHIKPFSL